LKTPHLLDRSLDWLHARRAGRDALFRPQPGEDLDRYFAKAQERIVANPRLLSRPFAKTRLEFNDPASFSRLPLHWLFVEALNERARLADANSGASPSEARSLAAKAGFFEQRFLEWVALAPNVDEVAANRWSDSRWPGHKFYAIDARRILSLAIADDAHASVAPIGWIQALLAAGADASDLSVGSSAPLFRAFVRKQHPFFASESGDDAAQIIRLLLDNGADPSREPLLDPQDATGAGRVWSIAAGLREKGVSLAPIALAGAWKGAPPGAREAVFGWLREQIAPADGPAGPDRRPAAGGQDGVPASRAARRL
jgi:hypothetical protein